MKKIIYVFSIILGSIVLSGCSLLFSNKDYPGELKIDGSSTVAPISEAMVEDFAKENKNVNIVMGISGTGGGFKKFILGETAISNASRHIKDSEKAMAEDNNIDYHQLEVVKDALCVIVSKENDWANNLSVEQLQRIWSAGNENIKWSDIDKSWPDVKIKLYGPGLDSGTYDYFKEVIIKEDAKIRDDYMASGDYNVLVIGTSGDKYALSFVGYTYYKENTEKVKALSIDMVEPTLENIQSDTYHPLSRPLFIYVNKDKYNNDRLTKDFVDYYLNNVNEVALEVGYVNVSQEQIEANKALLKEQ